jgi:hypothetical protein
MEVTNDTFEFFPDDVIYRIAILEPIEGISNLCKSSPRINNIICNNNTYWRDKFIYHFGDPGNVNII